MRADYDLFYDAYSTNVRVSRNAEMAARIEFLVLHGGTDMATPFIETAENTNVVSFCDLDAAACPAPLHLVRRR